MSNPYSNNSWFLDPYPQEKDYPDTTTWLEALHEYFLTRLTFIEGAFNKFRDDFIALENPTRKQADSVPESGTSSPGNARNNRFGAS